MQPASTAFLILLFSAFAVVTAKLNFLFFPRLLTSEVNFNEFVPSTNMGIKKESVYVCNFMLLQDFPKARSLKITCCVNYCTFLNKQVTVISRCYAFCSYFIFCCLLPQLFPLLPELFNLFLLGHIHVCKIPP